MADEKKTLSRSQKINVEITSLLRARTPLLWIVSREEKRVEAALLNSLPPPTKATEGNPSRPMNIRFWDCVSGLVDVEGKTLGFAPASNDGYSRTKTEARIDLLGASKNGEAPVQPVTDPLAMLQAIREVPDRCLYILRDINAFKDPITLRSLRNTAAEIGGGPVAEQRAMVILTTSAEIPPDLLGQTNLIEYPLPDRSDIEKIFDSLPIEKSGLPLPSAEIREAAVDAALGLSAAEMQNCFNRSLVTLKRICPSLIAKEKKQVIAREKVLTWMEPNPGGMDSIGGLEVLKDWLKTRRSGFSPAAREYGLKAPKGILLAGVPGGGKSLTGKSLSADWGMPLLKLDLGGQKSKYVGDSEANIRKALQIAEAVAPCILFIDEIEKAIGGGGEDGGVSKDQLGTLLSWMQDKEGSVFVIATANDVRSLPPELLRKGRFDQLFWVDLPTAREREQILLTTLKQEKRENGINLSLLTERTKGWVGAEIASIVPEAMFSAFNDGCRQITTDDLLRACKTVVPLSVTMGKKLGEIREFMADKAVNASLPETTKTETAGLKTGELDL